MRTTFVLAQIDCASPQAGSISKMTLVFGDTAVTGVYHREPDKYQEWMRRVQPLQLFG